MVEEEYEDYKKHMEVLRAESQARMDALQAARRKQISGVITKVGSGMVNLLRILTIVGVLTAAGYLSYTEYYQAPSKTRHWYRGVVVEKYEALDAKGTPLLVLANDSLHQNIPVGVSWTTYVNVTEGDSIRVRLRDKEVERIQWQRCERN
jgi:hypothetical protein